MSQIKLDEVFKRKKGNNNQNGISVKTAKNHNNNLPVFQKLFVDVHEDENIIEMLRKERGIYVVVVSLSSGDYAFSNIGIERKTLPDFYNSIVHGDKRIWRQMFELKRTYERPMLIIERWDNSFLSNTRIANTVYGALARIFLLGINVVVIPGTGKDIRPFVKFLSFLFFSSDKKTASLKPVPEKKKLSEASKEELLSDIISMIPEIGRKQADMIARNINSIKELCEMSNKELKKKCPLLGPKRLAVLRWLLNGEELPEKVKRAD